MQRAEFQGAGLKSQNHRLSFNLETPFEDSKHEGLDPLFQIAPWEMLMLVVSTTLLLLFGCAPENWPTPYVVRPAPGSTPHGDKRLFVYVYIYIYIHICAI